MSTTWAYRMLLGVCRLGRYFHEQKGRCDWGVRSLGSGEGHLLGLCLSTVSGTDLTSVLGMAQPHLSDLPTPGLQLWVSPHNIVTLVEEMDHPLHIPAQRRKLSREQKASPLTSAPLSMAASHLPLTVPGPDPIRLVFRGFNSHVNIQLVYCSIVKMKALLIL